MYSSYVVYVGMGFSVNWYLFLSWCELFYTKYGGNKYIYTNITVGNGVAEYELWYVQDFRNVFQIANNYEIVTNTVTFGVTRGH